ncbi:Bifunctional protein FolD [Anaerococcus octavius]|uniref:methenyltetrahydrofolate cyclohydrolase n=1 Tax=Anaerococcus octavius TaxID=54007 RepID=A0A380WTP4_9FIRM|nr:bifunctional 5,10-methylenetetrahydrofolate dehydrogenase/5,10-methenyltetrahydrofolate cyclohydrolase [Anaerococcus octavius]SUU92417.1 Bifunctional protein FolD [Anaerococcus octavius]
MKILNTNNIKNELITKLKYNEISNKVLLLTYKPSKEGVFYKNFIIKRCIEFGIEYIDHEFEDNADSFTIVNYINSFDKNDGFIIFLPFGDFSDIDYLRENITIKDLDGFTNLSMGKSLNGEYKNLPATPKAIARFLIEDYDIKAKNVVIANNTNLIGLPLATFLSKKNATVTILNSSSTNDKAIIKNADIFISAIGKANFYDKSYFKDGQLLIDVGTSYVNGKIIGDIKFDDLENLDIEILTSKNGIGSITTLTLLENLID